MAALASLRGRRRAVASPKPVEQPVMRTVRGMKSLLVAPSRRKAADAERWAFCAGEHSFCSAPYGATVHYGVNGGE
jgi:hypothetical protein